MHSNTRIKGLAYLFPRALSQQQPQKQQEKEEEEEEEELYLRSEKEEWNIRPTRLMENT